MPPSVLVMSVLVHDEGNDLVAHVHEGGVRLVGQIVQ